MRIGVRVSDPSLLEQLDPFLPPGHQPAPSMEVEVLYSVILGGRGSRPGVRRFHVVFAGGEQIHRSHHLDHVLEALEATLRLDLGIRARRRLFVHAGAVGIRGGGLVIPGRSESGKSTLTRALLEAGATYFSDEYAVLDAHRKLHPYPIRLSLAADDPKMPNRRVPASEFGAPEAREPAPVRLVLATRYRPGSRFRPRRLTPARGLLAVLAHAVPAQWRPRSTFFGLARLVETVPVFASDRPDTESVIEWLCREGWFDRKVSRAETEALQPSAPLR